MGSHKYVSELWKKKQCDVMRFLRRIRTWHYRQLSSVHRASRPTRPDKAKSLGYRAKQGKDQGINQLKFQRSLQSVAEERVGRRCGGLRVLSSYWIAEDSTYKYYEIIMVDPFHKAIRRTPDMQWICKNVMKAPRNERPNRRRQEESWPRKGPSLQDDTSRWIKKGGLEEKTGHVSPKVPLESHHALIGRPKKLPSSAYLVICCILGVYK
ncbi:ribosomal protein L15 [Apostichopus japonicus]|uniref:Ribosomal protein L15 n=1 Tax=Stichopus japonicus TaxID=307972 RepID=A0A2G8JGS3_STIJA|nr:ribosomal protein L15 [Apostichopus japonicus]